LPLCPIASSRQGSFGMNNGEADAPAQIEPSVRHLVIDVTEQLLAGDVNLASEFHKGRLPIRQAQPPPQGTNVSQLGSRPSASSTSVPQ